MTRIGGDLRTLAHDEVELAREELHTVVRASAVEVAVLVISSLIAVIGLAMLCVTAVVAADVLIDSLALRLLIGTVVYIALGSILAYIALHRLSQTLRNPMTAPAEQATRTATAVKDALTDDQEAHHA